MVILLGTTIFALIVLLLILSNLDKDTREIGLASKKVMMAAQEGDNLVNYIDISAKHATRDTEFKLASKGGMENTECGTFNGISYWYVDGKLCLPKTYNSDFKILFNNELNKYTQGQFNIPNSNYVYTFTDNKFIGNAKEEISIIGEKLNVPTYESFQEKIIQEQTLSQQASTMTIPSNADTVRLVFGGDATTLDKNTNPFNGIMQELQNALVFINLETLITELPYQQYMIDKTGTAPYHFRVLPKHADYMKQSNVGIVNLANNHAGDFSVQGITDTTQYLEKNNIAYCGVSKDKNNEQTPTIITSDNGIKIAYICQTQYVNKHNREQCGGVNGYVSIFSQSKLANDISAAKQAGADIVIVSLHWGTVSDITPEKHISASRSAINAGADIIIGHGPHRIQGIEFIEKEGKQKIIVYSLGNLLAGNGIEESKISKLGTSKEARKAILFTLDIDKNANVHAYKITPLNLASGHPKIAEGNFKTEIINNIIDRSKNYPNGYKQDSSELITTDVTIPTIDDTDCQITQFPSNSESLGHVSFGMVKNAAYLKKETENYIESAYHRKKFYGTTELINTLERAACIVKKATGVRVAYRDLSAKEGGKIGRHVSHQSGRDVDIHLIRNINGQLDTKWAHLASPDKIKYFDAKANWILVKALVDNGNIKLILLDEALINKLLNYGKQNEPDQSIVNEIATKLKKYAGHDDHYHLRVDCSIDDSMCKEGKVSGNKQQLLTEMKVQMES